LVQRQVASVAVDTPRRSATSAGVSNGVLRGLLNLDLRFGSSFAMNQNCRK
jgi:hypothetical protein